MSLDISALISSVANKSISPAQAADQLTNAPALLTATLPDDGGDTEGVESFFWDLWGEVLGSAKSRNYAHSDLVELLVEVAKPDRAPARTWRIWGQELTWKDLPLFGAVAREEFNGPSSLDDTGVNQWVALNAFLAQVNQANGKFMLYAIWSLRDALEEEPSGDIAANSANVRAAAQWIFYSGEKVYNSTEEFESGPQVGAPAKGGPKWNGKHGFDPQRWALWKQEFAKISIVEGLVDELGRQDAKLATERMEEIEKA